MFIKKSVKNKIITNLHTKNIVGTGVYSDVYVLNNKSLKEWNFHAIKMFKFNTYGIPHSLIAEICNTHNIQCKHIINYGGIILNNGKYGLLMKMHLGNMRQYINQVKYEYRLTHIMSVTYKLLHALYVMKQHSILNRDIKPENILMNWHLCTDNPTVCLCDYGLSIKNKYGFKWSIANSMSVYTMWYRPPEIALCNKYDYGYYNESADMWALGCVLYEYITGHALIRADNIFSYVRILRLMVGNRKRTLCKSYLHNMKVSHEIKINKLITNQLPYHQIKLIPKNYIDMLSRMLKINPKKRISVDDALSEYMCDYGSIPTYTVSIYCHQLSKYLCTTTNDINPLNKQKLLGWLLNACEKDNCVPSTYILAVDIFDKYTSAESSKLTSDNIMIHIVGSLSIAFKYNEQNKFKINKFNKIYSQCISEEYFGDIEIHIFENLQFEIHNEKLSELLLLVDKHKYVDVYQGISKLPQYYTNPETNSYEEIFNLLKTDLSI